jgi:hypothetical protein
MEDAMLSILHMYAPSRMVQHAAACAYARAGARRRWRSGLYSSSAAQLINYCCCTAAAVACRGKTDEARSYKEYGKYDMFRAQQQCI